MTQFTFDGLARIGEVFPDGKRCRHLKTDDASGMMVSEEIMRMGTCGFRGGDCYDRECQGCASYETA